MPPSTGVSACYITSAQRPRSAGSSDTSAGAASSTAGGRSKDASEAAPLRTLHVLFPVVDATSLSSAVASFDVASNACRVHNVDRATAALCIDPQFECMWTFDPEVRAIGRHVAGGTFVAAAASAQGRRSTSAACCLPRDHSARISTRTAGAALLAMLADLTEVRGGAAALSSAGLVQY